MYVECQNRLMIDLTKPEISFTDTLSCVGKIQQNEKETYECCWSTSTRERNGT